MTEPQKKQIKEATYWNLKWVAGVVVLLLFAYATRSGFVVYSLYAVLLVMLLSRLMAEICLRGFECEREVSRLELAIGEQAEVMLKVRNKGFLPIPWVFIEDLVPERMPLTGERIRLLTLMPGQEEVMLYQITFNRRGYHQIGPSLIEAGDLFGFFRRFKTGADREYVTALPAVENIMEYDIATRRPLGSVKVTNRIFEDPTRIVGVREYVPGDPYNRIHWKTSARTGVLQSKVFEPSRVIGATIVLDFHQSNYRGPAGKDRGELAVMLAASLANYISEAREQVGLLSNGRDPAEVATWLSHPILGKEREQVVGRARDRAKSSRMAPLIVPTRKTAEQGYLILETLGRVDYTDGFTIDKVLQFSIQHLSRDATILLVTSGVTDDLAVTLSIMKESGFSINVFIVSNEQEYFGAAEKLAPRSIDVFHIHNRGAISKYATHDVYY